MSIQKVIIKNLKIKLFLIFQPILDTFEKKQYLLGMKLLLCQS